MHKTLMAFIAAMLIATSPICADTPSTESKTTVTVPDDATLARMKLNAELERESLQLKRNATWEKEHAEWRKQAAASQAATKKTMLAFMTFLGAGLMAHGYWHYDAAKQIYNATSPFTDLNLSVVNQQSMAYASQIGGAIITAMAAVLHYTLPEPSSDEQV